MTNKAEKYVIKPEVALAIKNTFKYSYFIKELGYTKSYISLVLSGKKSVPRSSAYAFTKVVNYESKVEDMFDVI